MTWEGFGSPFFVKGGETMLKDYILNGLQFQFEEGQEPAGAVPVEPKKKAVEPPKKAVKPANKARKAVSTK